MNSPASPPVRLYRTAVGWRLLLYATLPLLAALFGWGAWTVLGNAGATDWLGYGVAGFCGLLAVGCLYVPATMHRTGFLVAPDRLVEQNVFPFASRELLLRDIAGIRTDDKFVRIQARQPGQRPLRLAYTTERYAELRDWLTDRYGDLDEVEAAAEVEKLQADSQAGLTEDARAAHLQAARLRARLLNGAGLVVAAWLLYPHPYPYAIAAGIAVPLLIAAARLRRPQLLRLNDTKNSTYPSVGAGLLMSSLLLAIRALFDQELMDYTPVWPLAGQVGAAFAGLLVAGGWPLLVEHGSRRQGSLGEWLMVVMAAVPFAYGAVVTSNSAFDLHKPTRYQARVLSQEARPGKATTYYLTLGAWGPRLQPEKVQVSHEVYAHTQPNDTITIYVKPGWLHIPWLTVQLQ